VQGAQPVGALFPTEELLEAFGEPALETSTDLDDRIYLDVPYAEKDEAYDLKAKWDPDVKRWYVPPGKDPSIYQRWAEPKGSREIHQIAAMAKGLHDFDLHFQVGLEPLAKKARLLVEGLKDLARDLRTEGSPLAAKIATNLKVYYIQMTSDFAHKLEPNYAAYLQSHSSARITKALNAMGAKEGAEALRLDLDVTRVRKSNGLSQQLGEVIQSLGRYSEKQPSIRGRMAPLIKEARAIQQEIPTAVRTAAEGTMLWNQLRPQETP
jgi:hypothetical protein